MEDNGNLGLLSENINALLPWGFPIPRVELPTQTRAAMDRGAGRN